MGSVNNMGAANTQAAVEVTKNIAKELGIRELKIAGVLGDDIYNKIDSYKDKEILELGYKLKDLEGEILSANVYLGTEGIVEALENGADIIITGRVADPSLFLAPMIYEFKWTIKDKYQMGQGVLAGHLLECAGQVTGGYFADPGYKDVENLHLLGFPIVEIDESGDFIVTKVKGSGGKVSSATCKEQMLYEIHDPSAYFTPDIVADFSKVTFEDIEDDVVKVTGASSKHQPETLKVSIGYKDCFIGEGEISYGGTNAINRAKLAADIVEKRLKLIGANIEEYRVDFIGYNSLYKDKISSQMKPNQFSEIRLRISGRTKERKDAVLIGNEVEALYTNGPAGGGGASKKVSEIISICSIFIPRDDIEVRVIYEEV
ncbi:MAG: DUF1446 domain-containing protein [Tissierellia bacterium]|nr:DUF1446 domain-containing protein [Tissierellia bacterium]